MKTILVPTDFSKNAENALLYAINLAKKMQAKIVLMHSFHVNYTSGYVPVDNIEEEIEKAEAKSNAQLKVLYNKISHHSKLPIECISSQNLVVDAVLTIIEEKNIDIVVMGTQGANGNLGRQIFGTNSSKVIEKAKCPVLTIPENTKHTDIKTIVYATEYLDSDIPCLQNVAEMAKLFEAEIQVIHVSIYEDESEKKLLEEFELKMRKSILYENISFKILVGNDVEQKMEGFMEEEVVDMLVLSAHHRNLMDKLFGKSITKELSFYLKIPLLVFHHERNKSDNAADHTVAKLIL
ncbi:MAG: universal stress protein [Bacteroidia bacterium]